MRSMQRLKEQVPRWRHAGSALPLQATVRLTMPRHAVLAIAGVSFCCRACCSVVVATRINSCTAIRICFFTMHRICIVMLVVLCALQGGRCQFEGEGHPVEMALDEWDRDGDDALSREEWAVMFQDVMAGDSHTDHSEHDHKRAVALEEAHDHEHEHEGEHEEDHDEHEGEHEEDHDEDHDEHEGEHEEDHDEHEGEHEEDHDEHEGEHEEDHDEHAGDHEEDHDEHEEDHDEHEEDHDEHEEDHEDEHDHDDEHDDEHDHGDEHGDEHDEHDHDDHEHDADSECLEDSVLLDLYDYNVDGYLQRSELEPAMSHLVMMIHNGCGKFECDDHSSHGDSCSRPPRYAVWLIALAVSFGISLVSLVGVSTIPVKNVWFRKFILEGMIAFAVGALMGSALLELLPEAYGLHEYEDGEDPPVDYIWPATVIMGAVFGFFLFERFVGILLMLWHKRSHAQAEVDMENPASEKDEPRKECKRDIKPVAFINLATDAVHNLIDGFAIGVAWSDSYSTGIAASLAILFHEIPQEFGDFAILIHSGFKKWQALLFNFLSGIFSIFGTVIGVAVGSEVQNANRWILAATGGAFLYMALVDMAPVLLQKHGIVRSLMQGICMAIGFGIMLIIAVFEEDLGACGGGHAH